MGDQGRTPGSSDPSVLLGRLAGLLAEGAELAVVLDELTAGLGLRTAVLRSSTGELLAVGGEALHAVPLMRAVPLESPSTELPVHGAGGRRTASLTVLGTRPSQLPVLRAAAAVLGLALVPVACSQELFEDAEAERDALADALHDGPVQTLVVARYTADAAARGGDPAKARDAVQDALVELRRTLWGLRPRGDRGLVGALEQLATHLAERGTGSLGLVCGTDIAGPPAVLAYRLVQAVSGVGAVRVALRSDATQVVVDIDGGGPLDRPESWSRRVHALGGHLSAAAGRLRLVLPLAPLAPLPPAHSEARTAP